MAENKNKKKTSHPLVGSTAQPTTLDNTTTLDIDVKKVFADNIIEAGLSSQLDIAKLENFTNISNSRDQVYQLIDTMAQDSSVSAILKTYAENVCEPADNGHIIWCEANDPKISMYINYILNTMNADKNMYGWAYSICKYGDLYLKLFRESDYADELFKAEKVDQAYSARNTLNEALNLDFDEAPTEDGVGKEDLKEAVKLHMHSNNDRYSFYVEQVDDPGTMFELTKFGKTYGYIETPNETNDINTTSIFAGSSMTGTYNFRMKSADVNVFQADDFVHGCLEDNFTRYPETVELFLNEDGTKSQAYRVKRGKSLLYDNYKVWRERSLLENAALLNRITRSSIVRKVGVEVGDMPKEQVQQTLRRVKEMLEQKSAVNVDNSMQEYNNPGPMENNIYFATHGGQGNITIEAVGGDVDVKNLADLDFWNNKFYSAYGVPKQYYGWTDDAAGFNGGSSLAILSSEFAKSVKRVQNALIQMLTDAINLFLLNRGYKSYLNNFTLKMKTPVTQEEIDYRNELTNKINAISSLQSLFTDVEDKGRRLRILKALIASLNYGDEINAEIDAEIAAVEEAAKKAEEEAAAENTEEEATADVEATPTEEAPADESDNEDIDLGSLDSLNLEAFNSHEGELLMEDQEFSNIILTEDDLPSPADLDADKDFSENV
jgi:hypothetical protein